MRDWLLALACLAAAVLGIALFVASLEVADSSLARLPVSLFAWRPRDANTRPLPDALAPRQGPAQR